jgi:hypothetical protein
MLYFDHHNLLFRFYAEAALVPHEAGMSGADAPPLGEYVCMGV